MEELTPEQRIAQLEAEVAALRAAQPASQGPLHPAIEPRFFNGSLVKLDGQTHQVVGRSIDWDGHVTYTLAPASATFVPVDIREPSGPIKTGTVTLHDAEWVYDVAEDTLSPVLDEHISLGAKVTVHSTRPDDSKEDGVTVKDATDIQRDV